MLKIRVSRDFSSKYKLNGSRGGNVNSGQPRFKAENIKWDKRKMYRIYRRYENENKAAKTHYVLKNTTFKYIKLKLAGKYKMKNRNKLSW